MSLGTAASPAWMPTTPPCVGRVWKAQRHTRMLCWLLATGLNSGPRPKTRGCFNDAVFHLANSNHRKPDLRE